MAENIEYVKLSGRMKSVSKDKVLAETNSIFDENAKMFQEAINTETNAKINSMELRYIQGGIGDNGLINKMNNRIRTGILPFRKFRIKAKADYCIRNVAKYNSNGEFISFTTDTASNKLKEIDITDDKYQYEVTFTQYPNDDLPISTSDNPIDTLIIDGNIPNELYNLTRHTNRGFAYFSESLATKSSIHDVNISTESKLKLIQGNIDDFGNFTGASNRVMTGIINVNRHFTIYTNKSYYIYRIAQFDADGNFQGFYKNGYAKWESVNYNGDYSNLAIVFIKDNDAAISPDEAIIYKIISEGLSDKCQKMSDNISCMQEKVDIYDKLTYIQGGIGGQGIQNNLKSRIRTGILPFRRFRIKAKADYAIRNVAQYDELGRFKGFATGSDSNKLREYTTNGEYYYAITFVRFPNDDLPITETEDPVEILDIEGNLYQKIEEAGKNINRLEKNIPQNKSVKVLFVGNSFTEDAYNYLPWIIDDMVPSLDMTYGMFYIGGASLENYDDYITNDTANENPEAEWRYTKWSQKNKNWEIVNVGCKVNNAIKDENWDLIVFQQSSYFAFNYDTYQPHLNNIIKNIYDLVKKSVRLGFLITPSRECNYERSVNDFGKILQSMQRVYNETAVDFLIPCGTAIQNARTTSLKALGQDGNLLYNEHMQEGIGCLIESYTAALSILRQIGYSHKSIYGDKLKISNAWYEGKNIYGKNRPTPSTEPIGMDDSSCRIGQVCSIMAIKNPLTVTDCSNLE